ncbi:MAG TPA: peptidase C1, partial [Nitratifractor sp.]|nr:peptidase C1 [Nitratifractor sp.]
KDSVVDMQAAIVEVGAIYCSAMVHTGWQTLGECDTLPLIKYSKERVGGHAFAIVGYNRDGFIVQNSWGSKWGFKGFAVISYKEWVESAQDAWVSVRGAPLEITDSPDTFSSMPLQAVGTDYNKLDNVLLSKALKYNYSNPQIAPWSEQKAYQHSLVIGNDGRPKHTIISAPSVEASAEIITYENVKGWMQKSKKNRKVLIYAHGGLNSEQSSINRVRVMAPYFKANGVYPLFITWKTGFLESITDQIEDKLHSSFKEAGIVPSSAKAKGILEKLQEAIDRAIEDFSRKVVVKGVWSEMKENAAYANDRAVPGYSQHGDTKAGGMVLLAKSLKKLKEEFDCELHIVGHSAGSILLGHWLDELSRREVVLNSCTLYAPACTVEFANKYYIAAHKNGTLSKSAIDIYMMDDEREKADNVGPYKKSLLYLVSRALEDIHKTPLLGMAASWDIEYAKENSVFNQIKYPALKRWIKFSKGIRTHIYTKLQSQVPTSLNGDTIRLSHGSFDNNIEIIEETIKRVSKKDSLEFPVENLNGY